MNPLRTVLAAFLIQGLFLGSGFGCGLDWSLPDNHFENVNSQGKFSYWQKLGEIKVGDDFTFPIHLNFRGDRHMESAGLGVPGFMLGLTDSSMVALDERRFLMQSPSGRYRTFRRDRKNPHILESGPKWAGEIQGDVITVSMECGTKLVFQQGRLARLQVKERTFEFIHNGNRVTEVREGGRPLATLRENRLAGAVELVKRGGEVITFELGKRPLVQALAGSPTPVIGGLVSTVSKITLPDGQETRFDFGTDETLLPTLNIAGGEQSQITTSVWNPGTGAVVKDGNWTYEIKAGEEARDNAAIGRKDAKGQSEFWHHDKAKGKEIVQGLNGVRRTTTRFVNGKLAGNIRTIVEESLGKSEVLLQNSFDELGRLLASRSSDNRIVQYKYKDDERTESHYVAEKLVRQMYFKENRLERTIFEDGSTETNQYSGDVRTSTLIDAAGKIVAIKEYRNGLLKESNLISRVEKYSYEPNSSRVARIDWNDGTVFRFAYDKEGRQIASYKNEILVWFRHPVGEGKNFTVYYNSKGGVSRVVDMMTASNVNASSILEAYPALNQAEASRYLHNEEQPN